MPNALCTLLFMEQVSTNTPHRKVVLSMNRTNDESITGLSVVGFEMQAVHSLKRVNESAL